MKDNGHTQVEKERMIKESGAEASFDVDELLSRSMLIQRGDAINYICPWPGARRFSWWRGSIVVHHSHCDGSAMPKCQGRDTNPFIGPG